jgi:2-iminobutanoate/2-iminopropanoate deaminase
MRTILGFVLTLAIASGAAAGPTSYFRSDANKALARPFSDAVEVGGVLYISGQIGAAPGQPDPVKGGIEPETVQVMENIGAVLKARGLTYDSVFKCTVMLADMSKWGEFNTVYVRYFKSDRLPARSAFGANGLARGASVELECWANAAR